MCFDYIYYRREPRHTSAGAGPPRSWMDDIEVGVNWFLLLLLLWALIVSIVVCIDDRKHPNGHTRTAPVTAAELQEIKEDDERLVAGIQASLGLTDSFGPSVDLVSKNK